MKEVDEGLELQRPALSSSFNYVSVELVVLSISGSVFCVLLWLVGFYIC